MKNKGFTLIELLAVIVILAVIALIATPLIMGTISKAKINSFKDSMYGILKEADRYTAETLLEQDNTYKGEVITLPETGNKKLNYKGQEIKGEVVIDEYGSISMKANNASKCFYKDVDEKEVKEYSGDCSELKNYQGHFRKPTDEKYFSVISIGNDRVAITNYDVAGGLDVVIPDTIGGKEVVKIGYSGENITPYYPFYNKGITSVLIPDSVFSIDTTAFYGNQLKKVIIPSGITGLWGGCFQKNQLEYVEFKGNVPDTISNGIFEDNPKLLEHTIKVPNGKLNQYITKTSTYNHKPFLAWFGNGALSDSLKAFYEA